MENVEGISIAIKILATVLGVSGIVGVAIAFAIFGFSDMLESLAHLKDLRKLVELLGSPFLIVIIIGGILGILLGDTRTIVDSVASFIGGAGTALGTTVLGTLIIGFIVYTVKNHKKKVTKKAQ